MAHFQAKRPAPRRNPGPAPMSARVALVMGRDIDFGQFGAADTMLADMGVRLAPLGCGEPYYMMGEPGRSVTVIPTASLQEIVDGSLAGVVVPGGAVGTSETESGAFDKLVNTTFVEQAPILAMGEGVARTFAALGYEMPEALPPGVLIHEGIRILETVDDLRDAVQVFRRRAAAAAFPANQA